MASPQLYPRQAAESATLEKRGRGSLDQEPRSKSEATPDDKGKVTLATTEARESREDQETHKDETTVRQMKQKEVAAKRAQDRRQELLAKQLERKQCKVQERRREQQDAKQRRLDMEVEDEQRSVEEDSAPDSKDEADDKDSCEDTEAEAALAKKETVPPVVGLKRKRIAPAAMQSAVQEQPCTKQSRKADSLEGLKEALLDEANASLEAPLASREMLAEVCEEVCAEARSLARASRHEFLTSVLDMIGEALSEIHDFKSRLAESALEKSKAAEADTHRFEELSEQCKERRTTSDSKKAEVGEKVASLSESKDSLAEVIDAEKAASNSVAAAEKAGKLCTGEKSAAEAALKAFTALDANGAPSRAAEAKKLFKEVEAQLVVMDVSAKLFPRVINAIVPALQLKPESRSSFEEGALAAAEGCFTNYIREKDEELSALSRGVASALNRHRRASADVEQVREEIEEGAKSVKEAKEEQKACDAACREADRSRKEHKDHVAMLARAAKLQARMLADFSQMMQVFESLANGS